MRSVNTHEKKAGGVSLKVPLQARNCSPAPWPPRVGQLVVLLAEPRGFVGVLVERKLNMCKVRLLDSQDEPREYHVEQLIATGRSPVDLLSGYELTDVQLSDNLATERSLPDFEQLYKKPKTVGRASKKKEQKPLTEVQLVFIKRLLVDKLKAAGIKLKSM